MKRRAIGVLAVGLASSWASGQSFVEYFMDGVNLTDPGRGVYNMVPGDVVRLSLRVAHDGHGYGGGQVEILYSGADDGDITISEPNDGMIGLPNEDWEPGRQGLFRIVASDGPADATQPHDVDVIAIGGKVTDVNNDFFDFASTPPGLGGLSRPFPLASGEAIFVFDWVFQGGVWWWETRNAGTARLWRDERDVDGIEVPARNGDRFGDVPSPGSAAALLLGALLCPRRRRVSDGVRGGGR